MLKGSMTALITPFKNGKVDEKAFQDFCVWQIDQGTDALVACGTTGESPTLSHPEHNRVVELCIEAAKGRVPVIAGAGSNSTRESVDMIQSIQKMVGDTAVLCVTGYYNNPPQEGLTAHFETLSAETGAKIVIYNVPARTASYLEADTLIRLAADKNIIGLKQAIDFRSEGKFREDTKKVIAATKSLDFSVVSGEDDGVAEILALGGNGVITASGNIPEVARLFLKIVAAGKAGNAAEAKQLQEDAMVFVKAVFARKNPLPLAALFDSPLFQPLVSVRDTAGGEEVQAMLMDLVRDHAPSLKKYHNF